MQTLTIAIALLVSFSIVSSLPLHFKNYTFPITTNNSKAAAYFNLGIFHEFGFNQYEARAAMELSTKIDPSCAMCFFGMAYVWGPFLNHPIMSLEQQQRTYNAITKAKELISSSVTPLEAQLINTLSIRYPSPKITNQTQAFVAYANALETLSKQTNDPNVQVFWAQALMNLESNNYFFSETMGADSKAIIPNDFRPFSQLAYKTLTNMITSMDMKYSHHPLALHLFIHLTEAGVPGHNSTGAGYGEIAADRLLLLNVTGSGHLEHMPGHLYLRVGRYADAALANVRARTADVFYTRNELQPYGPCHNQYFGVYAACLAGMSANALDGSSHMRNVYAVNLTRGDAPGVEQGWNARLTTMVRFSLWDDILNDTNVVPIGAPPTPYATVLRHYSKGLAYLHSNTNLNNNVMAATQELNELRIAQQQILARNAKDPTGFNGMSVHLANVANDTLTAGILYFDPANINYAIALLQKAADNQNRWHYDEPPDWHMSIQQCLGQLLLDVGQLKDAETAFRLDLLSYPNNGWGLTGLLQTMVAQGNSSAQEIKAVRQLLQKAWKHADVPLPISACPMFAFNKSVTELDWGQNP